MATWNSLKKNIKSIKPEEMTIIDSLAYLHAERVKRGISQQEFAKRINMKQPQLAKIESMTSLPSLNTINRYAEGLDLVATISFKPMVSSH